MPGYELIGKEEQKNINEIFNKSNGVLFAHGFDALRNNIFRVRDFEKKLKHYFKAKHCLCVSSGTAAIKVALKSIGIKPGDEVITQSFNFIATIEAILDAGAKPIITNIDDTLNMCPKDLKNKITKKTKAIMPVHMLGFSANLNEIKKIAKKQKIPIVEDNCESVGAKYKNQYLGLIGDVGIFSFDFGKNITTGEGGCIFFKNKSNHKYAKEYHDHGHELNPKFPRGNDTVSIPGFNYRMTEVSAAVGLAQLKKLNFILKKNFERYSVLNNILKKKYNIRKITDNSNPSYDTFILRIPNKLERDKIIKIINKKIGTKILPDAFKWHCSKFWSHALDRKQINNSERAYKILKTCVGIPIQVKRNLKDYKNLAKEIINI